MAIRNGLQVVLSCGKTCTLTRFSDGRILSGGMDKLLCLWDAKVVKCTNLTGHNGSISKVKVDDRNVAVTSAYDSSLLVWNLDTRECCTGLFNGHKDAVMEFEWVNSLVVSGGRDGSVAVWDVNTGNAIQTMPGVHGGAVSKIAFLSDGAGQNLFMTAG
jgi:WD40 repeat protein